MDFTSSSLTAYKDYETPMTIVPVFFTIYIASGSKIEINTNE